MFYCQPCADERQWPTDFWLPTSRGACEVCGTGAVCFDLPSRLLPLPQEDA